MLDIYIDTCLCLSLTQYEIGLFFIRHKGLQVTYKTFKSKRPDSTNLSHQWKPTKGLSPVSSSLCPLILPCGGWENPQDGVWEEKRGNCSTGQTEMFLLTNICTGALTECTWQQISATIVGNTSHIQSIIQPE